MIVDMGHNTHVTFNANAVVPWVMERAGGGFVHHTATAIGRVKENALVAGVVYEDYNGANVICHIAGTGNWLNKTFLRLIFDYPFNQLGVKRITTIIAPDNTRSQVFTMKLGFTLESKLIDAHPKGDLWVLRMFKDDCRWIK